MNGVIAAAVVAHVPTLSRAEITPDFQTTLVQGEHRLGREPCARCRPTCG